MVCNFATPSWLVSRCPSDSDYSPLPSRTESFVTCLVPELRKQAHVVIAATHRGHYTDGKSGVTAAGDVEMAWYMLAPIDRCKKDDVPETDSYQKMFRMP